MNYTLNLHLQHILYRLTPSTIGGERVKKRVLEITDWW